MTNLRVPFLFAAVVAMTSVTSAQIRPNRPSAQVRREVNRQLPNGGQNRPNQRGVNRPPLIGPQAGRNRPPLNPNQLKKQQMQQRLMQAIGLTPGQRMRMQEIRRNHEDEVVGAGRTLRQARQALDRAIMSDPYNEADVVRTTEALATAHGDKVRVDARVRAQVRGVLTSDQVQRFHQLQREMRREMRDQQQNDKEREPGAEGGDDSMDDDILSLLF